jgi:hypothetical protein
MHEQRYNEVAALSAWFRTAVWPPDFGCLVLVRALQDEFGNGPAPEYMLPQLRWLFNCGEWERSIPEVAPRPKLIVAATEDIDDDLLPF